MKTKEIHSKEDFEKLITPDVADYSSDEFEFCLINSFGKELIRVIDRANIGNLSVVFQEIIDQRNQQSII